MRTTRPIALRARPPGSPEPDLTFVSVAHRAMRQDLARLAACLGQGADRDAKPAQARAICRYAEALLAAVCAYHGNEDDLIWPLIAATAGHAVDLTPLADDHQEIEAAAGRASDAIACFRADPGLCAELHKSVNELRDMVDEHIADKERQIVPAMLRYLSAEACRWCEKQIQRRSSRPGRRFSAPWLARYAQPDELSRLLASRGWPARIQLAASRPGYARLERRAFGTAAARP
jgi:Hemerythrin HHE cation binding domain